MRTFLSSHCLKYMGVATWRQRALLKGAQQTPDFEAYGLYNASAQKVGLLCLASLPIPAGREMTVFQLLDAMLAAVQLKRIPLLENDTLGLNDFVLLMGESLIQVTLNSQESLDTLRVGNVHLYDNQTQLVVTYHPLDLLLAPDNKKKAWEDLKKLTALWID